MADEKRVEQALQIAGDSGDPDWKWRTTSESVADTVRLRAIVEQPDFLAIASEEHGNAVEIDPYDHQLGKTISMTEASETPTDYALGITTVFRSRAAIGEVAPVLIRIARALECLDSITADDLPPFVEP